jgi:hypothetical protein
MTNGKPKLMDVFFLIDTTDSMPPTLKAAHDRAPELAIKNPEVDFHFG